MGRHMAMTRGLSATLTQFPWKLVWPRSARTLTQTSLSGIHRAGRYASVVILVTACPDSTGFRLTKTGFPAAVSILALLKSSIALRSQGVRLVLATTSTRTALRGGPSLVIKLQARVVKPNIVTNRRMLKRSFTRIICLPSANKRYRPTVIRVISTKRSCACFSGSSVSQ